MIDLSFQEILTEAKADQEYEKSFSSIPRDIFDKIVLMDPKTQKNSETEEILNIGFGAKQLLLPKYMQGEHDFLMFPEYVLHALENYYPNIKNYPKFPEFLSVSDFLKFMKDPSAQIELATQEDPITQLYKKYYADISREDFDKIISLDPKTNVDQIGEVAKNVLLPAFRKSKFDTADAAIAKAVEYYYENKDQLPSEAKELSRYRTLTDFLGRMQDDNSRKSDILTAALQDDTIDPVTYRPVKEDVHLLASSPNYEIINTTSHRANLAIGGGWYNSEGMHWCTGWEPNAGSENDSYFNSYTTGKQAKLYIILHKVNNRGQNNRGINWQLCMRDDGTILEFLNGHDEPPNSGNGYDEKFKIFLSANPEICTAIENVDPFRKNQGLQEASALLKYSSRPYSIESVRDINILLSKKELRAVVKEVRIKNIQRIPSALFANCFNLTTVSFDENLREIGAQAFKNCSGIKTIEFNEGLLVIGKQAFSGCTELKGSIRIPDSVDRIETAAFNDTRCTLKVNVNRGKKLIFDSSDKQWIKQHVQAIKL